MRTSEVLEPHSPLRDLEAGTGIDYPAIIARRTRCKASGGFIPQIARSVENSPAVFKSPFYHAEQHQYPHDKSPDQRKAQADGKAASGAVEVRHCGLSIPVAK